MLGKNRSKLIKKYEEFFKNAWGPELFLCDDGWFHIIDLMCNACQVHLNKETPDYKILEITKFECKFGILFVERHGGDATTEEIIRYCEKLSYNICEECGNPAKLYSADGTEFTRMQTLCDNHALQKMFRKIVE